VAPRAGASTALGTATLRPVIDAVASIAHTAAPFLVEPRQSMDVLVRLADRTVTGTIGGTYGNNIVSVTYAKLGARHRLQGWLELLALTATDPRAWQSVVVGRGGWSLLGPVGAELATTVLADLVALYDAGLAEALPFAPKTAAEYARIRSDRKSIANLQPVLQRVWYQERDAVYARFFPESLDELFAEPSRAEEVRGQLGEASRFGTLARRVWHVLLQCEELHR